MRSSHEKREKKRKDKKMDQEVVADFDCCSTSLEIACSFEDAKQLADFATFRSWSGFPIYASDDGLTRQNEEGTIVEVLESKYDTSDTYGYSYGFTKHTMPVTEEVIKSMKGRFILRSNGSKTKLTWSWTFDVSPLMHVAAELLAKGGEIAVKLKKTQTTTK